MEHNPLHLLIVEDDADTRANLRDILTLNGHSVETATGMADVLSRTAWSTFGAVILDRKLPDGTAEELLPHLRQVAPEAAVIVVTGFGDLDGAIAAIRHGAADYLLKPISPDLLLSRVTRIAEHRRLALEKSELEHQVRQAEKLAAVGQLTAGLAHEIGTPLNVISGRAEMLLERMAADDPSRGDIERILVQIERITKLVTQMLNFARTRPPEIRPIGLLPLVQEVLALFEHQVRSHHIAVQVDGSGPVSTIRADPDQMQQLLFNLLHNAIDAMPDGGTLTIRIDRTGPRQEGEDATDGCYMRLEIADTGVGIAPEHLTRVFEPFFTTKAVGKGTGLGLAVSHRIVQNHGGRIEVKSEVGEGTVFSAYLPIEPEVDGAAESGRDE